MKRKWRLETMSSCRVAVAEGIVAELSRAHEDAVTNGGAIVSRGGNRGQSRIPPRRKNMAHDLDTADVYSDGPCYCTTIVRSLVLDSRRVPLVALETPLDSMGEPKFGPRGRNFEPSNPGVHHVSRVATEAPDSRPLSSTPWANPQRPTLLRGGCVRSWETSDSSTGELRPPVTHCLPSLAVLWSACGRTDKGLPSVSPLDCELTLGKLGNGSSGLRHDDE